MTTYYAWVGQNATTGSPNPKTGRMSMFGTLYRFDKKSDRDGYVDDYFNNENPSEYAVKVNKATARTYCLGMSVADYEDYLGYCTKVVKIDGRWDFC